MYEVTPRKTFNVNRHVITKITLTSILLLFLLLAVQSAYATDFITQPDKATFDLNITYKATGYSSWPNTAKLQDGTLVIAYRTSNTNTHTYDSTGRVVLKYSSDNGATWSNEITVSDVANIDDRGSGLLDYTYNGREYLLINFVQQDAVKGVTYVTICDITAGDLTVWGSPIAVSGANTRYTTTDPIMMSNGAIVFSTYTASTDYKLYIEKSTDGGATWSEILVATDTTNQITEASIVETSNDGDLLIVCRSDNKLYYMEYTSANYGTTWTAGAVDQYLNCDFGTKVALSKLDTSTVLLTGVNSRGIQMYLSKDAGATWYYDYIAFKGSTNYGYPDTVRLNDSTLFVVWATNGASTSNIYGGYVDYYQLTRTYNFRKGDYNYYQSMTITGSTDGALTYYPYYVDVYTTSGTSAGNAFYLNGNLLQSTSFNDIRFTLNDKTTTIPFAIENKNATWAGVWLNLSSIPASPATTEILIWYGNSTVNSGSYPSAVFPLFDDFKNANYLERSIWAEAERYGYTMPGNTLIFGTINSSDAISYKTSKKVFGVGYAIETSYHDNSGYNATMGFGFGIPTNDSTGNYAARITHTNGTRRYMVSTADTVAVTKGSEMVYQVVYTHYSLRRVTGNFSIYEGSTFKTSSETNLPTGNLPAVIGQSYTQYTPYGAFDWLAVRKVTANPPTAGAHTAETEVITAFTITASQNAVSESDTTITLTITRNATVDNDQTVMINTTDGTAGQPGDYTALNEVVTFSYGELTQSVVLSIKYNVDNKPPKSFTVALSNPTGNATLGTPASVEIEIVNQFVGSDDEPGTIGILINFFATIAGLFPAIVQLLVSGGVIFVAIAVTGAVCGVAYKIMDYLK